MPDGEVAVSPIEETTEGTIIVDYSMDGIGALKVPIRLDIERGRVANISGAQEAETLAKLVGKTGECGTNMAEFAIGTNPMARLIGNLMEDKKKEGTIHVALGDNRTLGGKIGCQIHLDGLVTSPTVKLDERTIIENGRVLWDYITRLTNRR